MILIFGGTSEGRIAAQVCDQASKYFYYSTKNGDQNIEPVNGRVICGAMDRDSIVTFCTVNEIKLIIDAAHPYAEILHRNIASAASHLSIPVIRFERKESICSSTDNILFFDSLDQAVQYIDRNKVASLLALTGAKSAGGLSRIQDRCNVTLRIMHREESLKIVDAGGFSRQRLIYYDNDSTEHEFDVISGLKPSAILTKESGDSGGFMKKREIASQLGVQLLVIRRPKLPNADYTVFGEFGVRRAIEREFPDFFGLRIGLTSGSCSTAAATAALEALISKDNSVKTTVIELPSNEQIDIEINTITISGTSARCSVIKDGGDDPDITHGLEFVAEVSLDATHNRVLITGDKGVGVVTLPGLGIDIGESAINETPLWMIEKNIRRVLANNNLSCGVNVTISVPRGEEIAKQTFNPRLGIVGGISILGTSGIVKPFSAAAFLESIVRQIKIVTALGKQSIVISSGAKSERFIKSYFSDRSAVEFIHYGNLIGDTISAAVNEGVRHITLVLMIGKAVKLAAGALDTHSKKTTLDRSFLKSIALRSECSSQTIELIESITTARQLLIEKHSVESRFFEDLLVECYSVCHPLLKQTTLDIVLIGESGDIVAQITGV